MLIILPPSETKARGGSGARLSWDTLSFPVLNPIRRSIARDLGALHPDEALQVLKISENLRTEAVSNTHLLHSPTMPAIERFQGVLFDALSADTLPVFARERLAVGDALFGLVKADDLIPHYRLSAHAKVPYREDRNISPAPTMKKRWGAAISAELAKLDELIIDMRSGAYRQLGPDKQAITVRVESVKADGSRSVVSHFNKHYKGLLARALAITDTEPTCVQDVLKTATQAGFDVEHGGGRDMILVVRPSQPHP
ncbi:peroxide stress protein YaaA [Corynebacterium sp. ES2794-CONJ1]|uniref:peroxide stress protein YaaA n=1 Tax=unclassified Corynebacterium TaxID=2624378 RepID=UPI0021674E24|nr:MULTISPECIES: peroxide stress protein YaaA [unclassified Corynebacterium]MCS4489116.1 peroxide stress protein YaaA [Corynebacterium sp. ES2775-CONJ]MCS4490929.1 peroxide stress protein YaaA [Corynebacterium sp. ES2715-CONJ3]MCS4531189.1 peroxide stress protein YaaA [Corynebacterium sp. ES2730-CONJ]MCU9518557.1 peroxide stress protein YaaA [Corynebacterium sp. ES2794-CONJ1]